MIPLSWWLTVSAALFAIGVYGALSRRNAIGILMGIELVLNAVNINLVAFWRYVVPTNIEGQIFAIIVITVAAAEAAVGLAIVIAVYRRRHSAIVEDLDILRN
jgi:NADH-quinone oxidoreductase subunit K